jgi:biopolymer transport protein TolR
MAAIGSRSGSRRRTINEINMVPFIDVMLVLLIIFMVSAPLITTGVVDLPSVGRSKAQPEHVIHVVVGSDEAISFKLDEGAAEPLTLNRLADRVKQAHGAARDPANPAPVIISADKAVRYEAVVKVMDVLQSAGIQRVGLAVRNNGAR